MAADKVQITIIADDKFSNALKKAVDRIGKVDKSAKKAKKSVNQFSLAIIAANQALELFQKFVRGALGPLNTLLETTDKFRRMEIALTSLTGSVGVARASMDSLRIAAQKTPFTLEAITQTFVRLRSTGIKDTEKVVLAIVDAISAFGGSDEELKLAALAFQQMAGKGVISMEELRRQLGERIPTAIRIMAKELGLSLPELFEQVQSGTLESFKGINALVRGFQKNFSGAAERMLNSWRGATTKMGDAWDQFLRAIGETGLLEKAIKLVQSLTVGIRKLEADIRKRTFIIKFGTEEELTRAIRASIGGGGIDIVNEIVQDIAGKISAFEAIDISVASFVKFNDELEKTPENLRKIAEEARKAQEFIEKFINESIFLSLDDLGEFELFLLKVRNEEIKLGKETQKLANEAFKKALGNALEVSIDLVVGFDAILVEVDQQLVATKIRLQELADQGFEKALQAALQGSIDDLGAFESALVDAQIASDKLKEKTLTLSDALKAVAENFAISVAQQIPGVSGAISGFQISPTPQGVAIGFFADLILSNSETQEALKQLSEGINEVMGPIIRDLLVPVMKDMRPIFENLQTVMRDLEPVFRALGLAIAVTMAPMVIGLRILTNVIERLTGFIDALKKEMGRLIKALATGGGSEFLDFLPFHEGGLVQQKHLARLPGMRPDEGLAVLQTGEKIVPRSGAIEGNGIIIHVNAISPRESANEIRQVIEEMQITGRLS